MILKIINVHLKNANSMDGGERKEEERRGSGRKKAVKVL